MIANSEHYREPIKYLGDHMRELVYVHTSNGNTSKDTGTEELPNKNENQPIAEHGYLWELVLMVIVVFALFLTCYLCAIWNQKRTKVRQMEDMKSQLKITKFRNIALHHHLQVMDIEVLQETSTVSPSCTSSQHHDSNRIAVEFSKEVLRDKPNLNFDRKEDLDKDCASLIMTVSIGIEDDWQHSCAICYEQFNDEDDSASSTNESCRHYYHVECILSWLIIDSNNHTCPICRDTFVDKMEQKAMNIV